MVLAGGTLGVPGDVGRQYLCRSFSSLMVEQQLLEIDTKC